MLRSTAQDSDNEVFGFSDGTESDATDFPSGGFEDRFGTPGQQRVNFQTSETVTSSPLQPPRPGLEIEVRGRSLTFRRRSRYRANLPTNTRVGERIRELVRRPRCGLHLLRSLRSDKQLFVPEPRNDPKKPPRHPGKVDKLFSPKDGDLLLHHVKKPGKRVLEFYDQDQPVTFENGDYLLRFKVDNYSFMHQTFVTTRGYLYHHGNWVYLGKDSDQMELI